MNDDLVMSLDDAIACVQDAGLRVITPRKSPDERVSEEVHQIEWALDRIDSAIRQGGRLHSTLIVDRFIRRLGEIRKYVLTRGEAEAI